VVRTHLVFFFFHTVIPIINACIGVTGIIHIPPVAICILNAKIANHAVIVEEEGPKKRESIWK
jgi:hypothetical protein